MSDGLKSKVIETIDSLIPKGQNSLGLREADMVYGINKAKEAVEKLFAEDSTQTNAESTQKSVVVTHDCINRQDAITLMCRALHYNYEEGYAVTQMLALPSTDIDLSVYSDRLWRKAYEQGKADAEPRKKGEWIDEGQYAEGHSEHAYYCSQCEEHYIGWRGEFNFCPNCGADMRGENE